MPGQDDDDYCPALLDGYLAIARRCEPGTLPVTALRTRSVTARRLLGHLAVAGVPLDELLAAARQGESAVLHRTGVNAEALADLARVIALQDVLPTDMSDGLALLDLVLEACGPRRLTPALRGFHAQLAFHLGRHDRARALLGSYRWLPDDVRANLRRDLANPFAAGDPEARVALAGRPSGPSAAWLRSFRSLFPAPRIDLTLAAGGTPFDRLRAVADRQVDNDVRISVVVTSFRPDVGLLTAVRSLIHQSWLNLEIIIVDDASPPECDALLARCLDLDRRVRLIKLATNGGTYVARNVGLDAATGRFVTFQDSDDWSHPRRLERQVRPLLRDYRLMATTSEGVAVTDDLILTRLGRSRQSRLNPSSVMLRRDAVVARIGYFDNVRKAADSEYLERIVAAFGDRALRHLADDPYALIRLSPDSLSRAEVRLAWMHPARTAYISAYRMWHEDVVARQADPYRPSTPTTRPFVAPAHLAAVPGRATAGRRCDVVFAADWGWFGEPHRSMIEEIAVLTDRGLRVGVLHLEDYRQMSRRRRPLCGPVQRLINNGVVDHVLRCDDVRAGVLVVRGPSVLQFAGDTPSRVRATQLIILADRPPVGADGRRRRYTPWACGAAARRLFSAEPLWCPTGPLIRDALLASLQPEQLAEFDLPVLVDPARWAVDRPGFRAERPVAGKHWPEDRVVRPADCDALLGALPDSVDVRLMCGPDGLRTGDPPGTWLVYRRGEVDVRSFLYQLDFYVEVPDAAEATARSIADRPIVEALAMGCLAILPRRLSRAYGDAAVYCDPPEVAATIARYRAEPEAFLEQSELARRRVGTVHGPDRYADLMAALAA